MKLLFKEDLKMFCRKKEVKVSKEGMRKWKKWEGEMLTQGNYVLI
jgi:hypothetical protein